MRNGCTDRSGLYRLSSMQTETLLTRFRHELTALAPVAVWAHGSLAAGFVGYGELTDADKRELTDLINALAEPLSHLTVSVLE